MSKKPAKPEPKRAAHFVLCDDVRQEIGSKISILGAFLNDEILVLGPVVTTGLPPGVQAILDSLSIAVSCPVAKGTKSATLEILQPDGTVMARVHIGDVEISKSGDATLTFRGRGFPVPAFGTYRARLIIGHDKHEYGFTIKDGRTPAAA